MRAQSRRRDPGAEERAEAGLSRVVSSAPATLAVAMGNAAFSRMVVANQVKNGTRGGDANPPPQRSRVSEASERALARAVSDRRSSTGAAEPAVSGAADRRVIAREPAPPAPAVPAAPAGPIAPTGDVLQDALTELRASGELLDRNTAKVIDSGTRLVRYLEDLVVPADQERALKGTGKKTSEYTVRIGPDRRPIMLPKSMDGFTYRSDGKWWILVSKQLSVAGMRKTLVHETNHTMRLDNSSSDEASFGRYKAEFQAYWISHAGGIANLDDRAIRVRKDILENYPALKDSYDTPGSHFKTLVDGHNRPDGNVLNSEGWRVIERLVAIARPADNLQAICDVIRAMSGEERFALRTNPTFMSMLTDKLRGDVLYEVLECLGGPRRPAPLVPGDFPTPVRGSPSRSERSCSSPAPRSVPSPTRFVIFGVEGRRSARCCTEACRGRPRSVFRGCLAGGLPRCYAPGGSSAMVGPPSAGCSTWL